MKTTFSFCYIDPSVASSLMLKQRGDTMYTIGCVAKRTGITERTIQYYDSLGLLTLTRIRGVRQLSEGDLTGLLTVLLLKTVNTKISDMKEMNAGNLTVTDVLRRLEEFELQFGFRCRKKSGTTISAAS